MVPGIFKKLNLKNQKEIVIIDAPKTFEVHLAELGSVAVRRSFEDVNTVDFALVFATTLTQLERFVSALLEKVCGDAVVWVAYPKKSSKAYSSELSRDSDWSCLGDAGFEAVRIVAIDRDWSALRFRRVNFIKKLSRAPKRAMSLEGKRRTARS